MLGIAVVGCGYWGPNVLRNFSSLDGCELRMICDRDPKRLDEIGRRYPACRTTTELDAVLAAPDVEGIAICTPVRTHHPIAAAALRAGKHVLVEKPFTHTSDAAAELIALAEAGGLVIEVDHTFVYSPAVQAIRSMIDAGDLGDLLYLDSVRVNLGLFQSDVNVVWDLAAHDLSIIQHLVGSDPLWVSAVGSSHYGELEDQAYVTVMYPEGRIAHVHVNWLAPVKLRSTLIGGSKRMVVYDDLSPSEKIRVYDKGVELAGTPESRTRALVDYRLGDMRAPYIDKSEPLEAVCRDFVAAIGGGARPCVDGRDGLAVVRMLEAAQRSIEGQGERVLLGPA